MPNMNQQLTTAELSEICRENRRRERSEEVARFLCYAEECEDAGDYDGMAANQRAAELIESYNR